MESISEKLHTQRIETTRNTTENFKSINNIFKESALASLGSALRRLAAHGTKAQENERFCNTRHGGGMGANLKAESTGTGVKGVNTFDK